MTQAETDEYIAQMKRVAEISLNFRRARAHGSMELGQRFSAIKSTYSYKTALVEAGLDSWWHCDPYWIADWTTLFSPIESMIWGDIRELGLSLWPQFPVGRYFVDFGNPVARVAVECDGAKWHNAERDKNRDAELAKLGWSVYRIPGWLCVRDWEHIDPHQDEDDLARAEKERFENTPYGILSKVSEAMACHEPANRQESRLDHPENGCDCLDIDQKVAIKRLADSVKMKWKP